MERIHRPGDDFRDQLQIEDIHTICARHGLKIPSKIDAEPRGNEKVIYHLDDVYSLQFLAEQEDADDLIFLSHIPEMPSPEVLAWCEHEARLDASYLLTQKCTGDRLDVLWEKVDESDRRPLLTALGEAMGRYHTVGADKIQKIAERTGLHSRVQDDSDNPTRRLLGKFNRGKTNLDTVASTLKATGLPSPELLTVLEEHYASATIEPFIDVGLTHGEPWAEHYIVGQSNGRFHLDGCVDVSVILIGDPAPEIVILYVSILGLNDEYYEAYKAGYETAFPFPDDGLERLRRLAIDFDVWSIVSLSGGIKPGEPFGNWRRVRIEGHYDRLLSWTGIKGRIEKALFRAQIGPW